MKDSIQHVEDSAHFWEKTAMNDHVLQIYEDDETLINTLAAFVKTGIQSGEAVVIVATDEHLKALNQQLTKKGLHVFELILTEQYSPINANRLLSKFMFNDLPDETLFTQLITILLSKVRGRKNRTVRVFGEMVAILNNEGKFQAAIELEKMWNRLREDDRFCLFCAYPKKDLPDAGLHTVCSQHSIMIEEVDKKGGEVTYRSL